MHAISSSGKPLFSWIFQAGIQNCRESCGGHGYLKASRLGELRNENDARCTYEGENSVLIQQTSKWLLSLYENMETKNMNFPLGSVDFLSRFREILNTKFTQKSVEETLKPKG